MFAVIAAAGADRRTNRRQILAIARERLSRGEQFGGQVRRWEWSSCGGTVVLKGVATPWPTPNSYDWKNSVPTRDVGANGGLPSANGSGAPCARITARTGPRGATFRTIMRAVGLIVGAKMGSPASATTVSFCV